MVVTTQSDHALRVVMLPHRPGRVKVVPREVRAAASRNWTAVPNLLGEGLANFSWRLAVHCMQLRFALGRSARSQPPDSGDLRQRGGPTPVSDSMGNRTLPDAELGAGRERAQPRLTERRAEEGDGCEPRWMRM